MKRWISILLGLVIFVSVPFTAKMTCEAAPMEVGVTTLSDAAFFNPGWAQMKLTISCGGKVWEKPFSELMGQEIGTGKCGSASARVCKPGCSGRVLLSVCGRV